MEKIKIDKTGLDRLFNSLESRLTFLRRRNLSYQIVPLSEDTAIINISVTGRKGMGTINFVLTTEIIDDYGEMGTVLLNNGNKYVLQNFSEISTIIRSAVANIRNKLNTL